MFGGGDIVKRKELQFVQQFLDFSGLKNGNLWLPARGGMIRLWCFDVGPDVERRSVPRSGFVVENGTHSNPSFTEHVSDVTGLVLSIGQQEQVNGNGPGGLFVAFRNQLEFGTWKSGEMNEIRNYRMSKVRFSTWKKKSTFPGDEARATSAPFFLPWISRPFASPGWRGDKESPMRECRCTLS